MVLSGFRSGDDLVTRFFRQRDEPLRAEDKSMPARPWSDPDEGELVYDRSFDELRTGFTAAVSHELRTPLARILALLDSADLPDADVPNLIELARAEVENAGALIDEILFLSELESGKEVVSLGRTTALPVLEGVVRDFEEAAARAGVEIAAEGDGSVDVPLRPRMLRMLVANLAENAVRYAGHDAFPIKI